MVGRPGGRCNKPDVLLIPGDLELTTSYRNIDLLESSAFHSASSSARRRRRRRSRDSGLLRSVIHNRTIIIEILYLAAQLSTYNNGFVVPQFHLSIEML